MWALPEHTREQDLVTRSLPWLLCSPLFQSQLPVASCQKKAGPSARTKVLGRMTILIREALVARDGSVKEVKLSLGMRNASR